MVLGVPPPRCRLTPLTRDRDDLLLGNVWGETDAFKEEVHGAYDATIWRPPAYTRGQFDGAESRPTPSLAREDPSDRAAPWQPVPPRPDPGRVRLALRRRGRAPVRHGQGPRGRGGGGQLLPGSGPGSRHGGFRRGGRRRSGELHGRATPALGARSGPRRRRGVAPHGPGPDQPGSHRRRGRGGGPGLHLAGSPSLPARGR